MHSSLKRVMLFLSISIVVRSAAGDELEAVLVEGLLPINPNAVEPDVYNGTHAVAADGADFLRQFNGVSISRRA